MLGNSNSILNLYLETKTNICLPIPGWQVNQQPKKTQNVPEISSGIYTVFLFQHRFFQQKFLYCLISDNYMVTSHPKQAN